MNWVKKNIPNLFTLTNLSMGVLAINLVLTKDPNDVPKIHFYVFIAALCDLLDGLLARKLKVQSPLGLQLDSLADLVTFGVLPTFIYANLVGISNWTLLLLLVPVCSAIRLARFNIDSSQKNVFKGISTTAHGLFVSVLPVIMYQNKGWFSNFFESNPSAFLILAVFFSILMVSPVKMIAFKFDSWSFKENWQRYLLVFSAIIALILWQYQSAPLVMSFYIILSAIGNFPVLSDKSQV